MGLLNRLFDKQPDKGKDLIKQPKDKGLTDHNDIEKAIAARAGKLNLTDCLKFSFTDIAALGTGFAQMLPALRTTIASVTVDSMGYIPINNVYGEELRLARKSTPNIFVGSFDDASTGKAVLANFIKAGPQNVSTTMVAPINPVMLMMAAMLVQVEKKLDNIQKTASNIMSFLEMDKQAEQQGNINILNDSLQNYKYNWDNQQYLQNHHMKALDIKQKAEQNMRICKTTSV